MQDVIDYDIVKIRKKKKILLIINHFWIFSYETYFIKQCRILFWLFYPLFFFSIMAHPDVIHETYHISHIAEWFHVFPHVDITFSSVNTTFDPSNSAYLEVFISFALFFFLLHLSNLEFWLLISKMEVFVLSV